jgi:N-acylneuraminate cytidylyltransferase
MLNGRTFLAVVPARGGSKAVPRKNIRLLGGRPLLVHTLEQIAAVAEIDCAVVSTDDREIAAIVKSNGGRAIDRPAELASDTAPTEGALLHAMDVLEAGGQTFDFVMVLEPTSPLRTPQTIRRCMQAIAESAAPSLMTVIETRNNIGRVEKGRFRPLVPGAPRRRQDRAPFFIESSTVYICRTDYLRRTGTLVADDWLAVPVPEAEAFDINSELDFAIAEAMVGQAAAQIAETNWPAAVSRSCARRAVAAGAPAAARQLARADRTSPRDGPAKFGAGRAGAGILRLWRA